MDILGSKEAATQVKEAVAIAQKEIAEVRARVDILIDLVQQLLNKKLVVELVNKETKDAGS